MAAYAILLKQELDQICAAILKVSKIQQGTPGAV